MQVLGGLGISGGVAGVAVVLAGVEEAAHALSARPPQELLLVELDAGAMGPDDCLAGARDQDQVGEADVAALHRLLARRQMLELLADTDAIANRTFAHLVPDPQPVDGVGEAVPLVFAASDHVGQADRPGQLAAVDLQLLEGDVLEAGLLVDLVP